MEFTGKSKTGEAPAEARVARQPPVVAEPQRRADVGSMAKSKNQGVNFHIEITVTKGEHAHVFKFECGDKHVTVDGKGLVKMHGNFEHLRKDRCRRLEIWSRTLWATWG